MASISKPRSMPFAWEPILKEQLWGAAQDMLAKTDVSVNVSAVTGALDDLWRRLPADEWGRVVSYCRAHPLKDVLHQDPFSKWSFDQPRGYPGDASLLDFIYNHPSKRSEVLSSTDVGVAVFAATRMAPAARAVRHRRDLIASYIDDVCSSRPNARLTSMACGHLREAEDAAALTLRSHDVFFALDQDSHSLSEVERASTERKITPLKCSVRDILSGKFEEQNFDFIYAAGLYDYLVDKVATRLTETLFSKLRSGGRLLIANFLGTCPNAGYMEVFMNWVLLLRTEEQFLGLLGKIKEPEALVRLFKDDTNSVVYLEITRR